MTDRPKLRVKNWDKFQHYKDRAPPWIKFHREILDDYIYAKLPLASKALAPMIWLLASESADGTVEADSEFIAFRVRISHADVVDGLKHLIEHGFLIDASNTLASRLHDACLETEAEVQKKRQRHKQTRPKNGLVVNDEFNEFWKAYPKKVGKGAAVKAWGKLNGHCPPLETVLASLESQKGSMQWIKEGGRFIPNPATWINEGRWDDQLEHLPPPPADGNPF